MPRFGVAQVSHKGHCVLIAAHVVSGLLRYGDKVIQLGQLRLAQDAAGSLVEQFPGTSDECRRTVRSRAKAQAAHLAIVQINFAIGRMKAPLQRRLAATPCFDARQSEFDMFAGTQAVGRKIGAGTKVHAGHDAPNRDPIATAAVGIGDKKIRKDLFLADIFQHEGLLATELATQANLPFDGGHVFGRT